MRLFITTVTLMVNNDDVIVIKRDDCDVLVCVKYVMTGSF